jgi:PKD repeat protein/C1A family cysteine protease
MNRSHTHLLILTTLAIGCLAIPSTHAAANPASGNESPGTFRAPWNGEELATGSRRPTDEEWAWGESNLARLERIPITPLGLQRVNNHRGKHGKSPVRVLFFDQTEDTLPAGDRSQTAGGKPSSGGTSTTTSSPTTGSLPSGVDNSTLKYFPPIRSQGSLNSCAQFAAVYYTLTHMTALARDWDAKSGGDTLRFSPKWTYNMVNGGGNNGSWHYDAYAIAQKHGLATWAEFPYDSNYRAWCLNPSTWYNAISFKAGPAGKIAGIHTTSGLDQMKQLLVNGYVLNFATYINSWVWRNASNDPSTPLDDQLAGKPCVTHVNGSAGGHSLTIVGYNDDLWVDLNANGVVDSGEKGALRVANSWGTGWNEGGFGWVSYNALRARNPIYSNEGLAWYDEATWVTALPSYSPRLVAQFTLSHAKRSQLVMSLGTSDTSRTTPATTWSPTRILSGAGGAYAFDGSTTPVSGTFFLDFSDLAPTSSGTRRFYLGMRDTTAGDPASVSAFSLIVPSTGESISAAAVPALADASQTYVALDYDLLGGLVPPVAAATATTASGKIPLAVAFDASSSHDPDGSIVQVTWDFGDGTTATGWTASHTYTSTGTFTATVTVTDNHGAKDSASLTITASDPTTIKAPTGLSIVAASRQVSLNWTDNSDNESGFRVERGTKVKAGVNYTPVAVTPANSPAHTENVAPNTYYYRVVAFDASTGRASDYSNTVSIRVR